MLEMDGELKLLLKSFSGYLAGGVIINVREPESRNMILRKIDTKISSSFITGFNVVGEYVDENHKPTGMMNTFNAISATMYLRKMSSLTEDERAHIHKMSGDWSEVFDYLDERCVDYRNLIGKGLALEAPEGMYKNE